MIAAYDLINKIVLFLQQEVQKRGYQRVVLGLSGGVDSAVVALLCLKAFGSGVKALLMPSLTSSKASIEDALELCNSFSINYEVLPITKFDETFRTMYRDSDLMSKGNFCARMRMSMLYFKSAEEKRLVIGTSNKSEIMLGYGTLHGDLACAINPIGSFFKTEVYEIAKVLGVTEAILSKTPSADLYAGQSDESELGYKYEDIDPLLQDYVNNMSVEQLSIKHGNEMVINIINRVRANAFKFEPISIYQR